MARNLIGEMKVHAKDDEGTFGGSDEFLDVGAPETEVDTYLEDDGKAQLILDKSWGWGGECRLEVKVFAQSVNGGEVSVFGSAKLFEGTSESTDDLEDEENIQFIVAKNDRNNPNPTTHFVELKNTDDGGDYAHLNFTFKNKAE